MVSVFFFVPEVYQDVIDVDEDETGENGRSLKISENLIRVTLEYGGGIDQTCGE